LNLDKFKNEFQDLLSDNKTSPELTLEKVSQNNTLIKKIKEIQPEITNDTLKNNTVIQELKQQNLTKID
jgi:hypothetical protein